MLTSLAWLTLVVQSGPDGVRGTPHDRTIELEITNDDLPLGDRGPAVVVEYEVEFNGTLHLWTRSELDLFLRVEDGSGEGLLAEDDNSGGGETPYVRLAVETGDYLAVLVASSAPGKIGDLELCLLAAPETATTLAMAKAARDGQADIRQMRDSGGLDAARDLAKSLIRELLEVPDGWRSESVLEELKSVGVLAFEMGALAAAGEAWKFVHDTREHTLPSHHRGRLTAKQDLALALRELGNLEAARSLYEYVHSAREEVLPAAHPALLVAKQDLALSRRDFGDLAGALELEEFVHSIREQTLPADHRALLAAKHNLAVTLKELGDIEAARPLQEQVHSARERTLPAGHPDLLTAKQNLALTLKELGDLESALALEEHVHSARTVSLPAEHPELLKAKSNLALTLMQLGDPEAARALFEHVLVARQRFLHEDHPDLLDSKQNLAQSRLELGDLEGARELFESVHEARNRLLPQDHLRLLKAKQNLAVVRKEVGDYEGALVLEEHVHSARVGLLPPDHWTVLLAKQNLAVTRKTLGDLQGALALEEHVHALRARLLVEDHPSLLTAKQNLAATRRAMGDLQGALALEEQVYAGRSKLLPTDHTALLVAMQNLALTRRATGDLEGSQILMRQLLSAQLERSISLRRESLRIARAGAREELDRLSLQLFLSEFASDESLDQVSAELFEVLENLRAVSMHSSRTALLAARSPEMGQLRSRFALARRALNDHVLSAPMVEPGQMAGWRARLVQLSDERDRLGKELRARLASHGGSHAVNVDRVADGIGEASALVSFLRYGRIRIDPGDGMEGPPEDSLLAFVVTPDARVRRVELGSVDGIEQLALAWRASLGKPLRATRARSELEPGTARGIGQVSEPSSSGSEWAAGNALRERLLDPCIAVLGEEVPQTLHLVLDDFLHLLPMEALPWDAGLRIGEVTGIRYETSMRRLSMEGSPIEDAGTLVAVGGADFDANGIAVESSPRLKVTTPPTERGRDRASATTGFTPLPQTGPEVRALAALYEENVADGARLLEGAAASKARLSELASDARFLHIATHGWFAPEAFRSMIDSVQGESNRDMFSRAGDSVRGFAPETLCGLAFAGANNGAGPSGKVPGIMTAEDLATLDLSNCELAVLSACETNVGLRRAGQGIQSLQAALHTAGARTAITSLWRVDDAATRRLMEIFYENLWELGLGKADALWRAKLALREEGHPVRDWSGWVLTGAPD